MTGKKHEQRRQALISLQKILSLDTTTWLSLTKEKLLEGEHDHVRYQTVQHGMQTWKQVAFGEGDQVTIQVLQNVGTFCLQNKNC
jgi:hypothetical protein